MSEPASSIIAKPRLPGDKPASKVAPARLRQPELTRERIVEAAIDSLHRFGYSVTTTILVAQNAQVSRGAMLHHFPTKALLMAEVARLTYERDAAFYQRSVAHAVTDEQRHDLIVDAAWLRFKSPDGIAQVEIWQASRSDPELAAIVMPVHDEVTARSQEAMHSLLKAAAPVSRAQSRSFLLFTVAALRGLAMELALGTAEADLLPGIYRIKRALRDVVEEARAATANANYNQD
ncbi:MAG TPA: hypothetical protein DIU09_05990 [Hyphomonadaceae bacterium]|nr:hypothetical protein [Hyphomonadaceae bacterium]